MMETELRIAAAQALKSIARNELIKQHIKGSEDLYPLLFHAAKRFIVGETKEDAVTEAIELVSRGYSVSLECIGENIGDEHQCVEAKNEFLELIHAAGKLGQQSTISLDLSHIGMTVNEELAYQHLIELAGEADRHGMTIMISAEEESKKDGIAALYKRVSESYPNVGITLQAYLHRTEVDLKAIKSYSGRIRLVKGAYQESEEIALPRSEQLRAKYITLVEKLVATGREISIATHDELIIEEIVQRGYLRKPNMELEMLYGIRPDLLKKLNKEGYRTRVYLAYGKEWHLYFFHRLAEYPPNMYRVLADLIEPETDFRHSLY